MRRLAWRFGRAVYSQARGEPRKDDIRTNGETYVQRCVMQAAQGSKDPFCALDVGANQGDWTLPLLDALPEALRTRASTRVHLFEPVPSTRQRLVTALGKHALGELTQVHALALSDKAGVAKMQIVSETGGRNSLVENDLAATDVIEIDTLSLAELFERQGIARAQLVKIDAEGHDLAILKGARALLAAGRVDVVQFEYNHAWVFSHAFLKDVFDLVEGLPFAVAGIRPRSIEVFEAWHPELDRFFHANYLLVRTPALSWFDVHKGRFDISNTYA